MKKKLLILFLLVLIAIQFIHPKRNKSEGESPHYIGKNFSVREDVNFILAKACLDCHSNNTRYPWYCSFQPIDWWIAGHVRNGKKSLNFDEFTNRSLRFQYHKLEETTKLVKDGAMPLSSYRLIHKDSRLTPDEKQILINWADTMRMKMKKEYPIDSLERKR